MSRLLSIILAIVFGAVIRVTAQTYPSASPTATYTKSDGEIVESPSEPLSAPVVGLFKANTSDVGDYQPFYEWRISRTGENAMTIVRHTEDFEYTFDESGTYSISLYITFIQRGDTIAWPDGGEAEPMTLTISESKLEFPNAFSPNGDGYNDIYRAKDGYQSIVSFEATIFNRWGVRLFSWDNLADGWDGRYHGSVVPDGVYYVVVKAKGADGVEYKIRRDVNVLTGTKRDEQGGATE